MCDFQLLAEKLLAPMSRFDFPLTLAAKVPRLLSHTRVLPDDASCIFGRSVRSPHTSERRRHVSDSRKRQKEKSSCCRRRRRLRRKSLEDDDDVREHYNYSSRMTGREHGAHKSGRLLVFGSASHAVVVHLLVV